MGEGFSSSADIEATGAERVVCDLEHAADEEVAAAIAGGAAKDIGVIKSFVCPVIRVAHS